MACSVVAFLSLCDFYERIADSVRINGLEVYRIAPIY
jgi:hypothetical protein